MPFCREELCALVGAYFFIQKKGSVSIANDDLGQANALTDMGRNLLGYPLPVGISCDLSLEAQLFSDSGPIKGSELGAKMEPVGFLADVDRREHDVMRGTEGRRRSVYLMEREVHL